MNDDYDPIKIYEGESKKTQEATAVAEEKVDTKPKTYADFDENELADLSEDELMALFVEQLILDKGMGDLDEPVKDQVRQDLMNSLVFQMNRAILNALPEDRYEEIAKKIEDGTITMEIMQDEVRKADIDVDAVVADTLAKFREVYLAEDTEE